tara:strand:- start:410 stop:1165 length:756 start_codon:yes stop_codon:yes gene_type:complete
MQKLFENWNRYLNESNVASIYGDMYLFEDDTVSKTSFYDAISVLSESGEDTARFLENWERSVDHMFENLNEQTGASALDDAVLKASTQAYMALQKLKGKAVAPVINVMKKLKAFEQKNPKTAKAIKFTLKGLAVAVATAGLSSAMAGGGGPEELQAVADALASVAPDVAEPLAQVAQADPTEVIDVAKQALANQEQTLTQVTDALAQSPDPGLQQVGQAAESTERVFASFGEMMEFEEAEWAKEVADAWED